MNSTLKFMRKFRHHAFEPALVKRAAAMSFVVGTVLVIINHGPIICESQICWTTISKIVMTMLIPYGVSTFSSVLAIEEN